MTTAHFTPLSLIIQTLLGVVEPEMHPIPFQHVKVSIFIKRQGQWNKLESEGVPSVRLQQPQKLLHVASTRNGEGGNEQVMCY